MHYYQKNIGDYAKKTGHLTTLEHGVYNLIIDGYYDRERGPTLTEAMRWARARTEEEKAAVLAILDEFFMLDGENYTQQHIVDELAIYKAKAEIAQINGKKGGRPAKNNPEKPSGLSVGTQQEPKPNPEITGSQANHKPITNNHKPVEKVKPTVPPDGETPVRMEVEAVFLYWQNQRGHERAHLDDKRAKAIKARLKDGYSPEDLCRAVDGIAKSAHHMGQNDSRTVYDDIELICRSAANVDKFVKLSTPEAIADPGLRRQIEILQEWAAKP